MLFRSADTGEVLSHSNESGSIPYALEVDEADLDQRKMALEAQIESESSALYSTGRVWDDGIIHPNDTRHVLTMALSVTHSAEVRGATEYGVWRH